MSSSISTEKLYNRIKLMLSITEFVIGLGFLVFILFTGFTKDIEYLVRIYIQNDYLALMGFVFFLGILESIILFPLSFYSGFILEHQFNLSNQTFGAWLWERVKGMLVSLPLILILLNLFYLILRTFPQNWWLILGTVMFVFSVLLARIAPVLIFPLFYKFKPLDDQDLAEGVEKLCSEVGMELKGVFQFDMSKNTKKANAAFTGMGKSRRVILGDTLLNELTRDEILSVLSHELGHFKLKHLWKSVGFSLMSTYLGLFLVAKLYGYTHTAFGPEIWTLAALPLIALYLTLFEFITTPVMNALSRHHERQADDFAIQLTGNSMTFISGLEKISKQNLADPDPHPLTVFMYHSHPPIRERLARL